MRPWRSTIGVAAVLAATLSLVAAPSGAQSPPPPACADEEDDEEQDPRCDPEAVILRGTITGTNSYQREGPLTDNYLGQAEMAVTLVLAPHRATSSGTAVISGQYSGDCQFSDTESLPIKWDSKPDPDWTFRQAEGRPGFALVEVFMSDPRYAERPLMGFYLSVGAGTGGEGGICGYETGKTYPVTDVDFPMRVDLRGCMYFEVLNTGGGWHGECREGEPNDEVRWTAAFQQVVH
jgi:hypothetical protein